MISTHQASTPTATAAVDAQRCAGRRAAFCLSDDRGTPSTHAADGAATSRSGAFLAAYHRAKASFCKCRHELNAKLRFASVDVRKKKMGLEDERCNMAILTTHRAMAYFRADTTPSSPPSAPVDVLQNIITMRQANTRGAIRGGDWHDCLWHHACHRPCRASSAFDYRFTTEMRMYTSNAQV